MRDIQTAVVTGGLGFIGSHFVEAALKRGWVVKNIDKKTYASNDIEFGGNPNYSLEIADIKELKALPGCDLVVNFAAESHVDNSIGGSTIFLDSNIAGVHNLLNLIIRQMQENFLHGWNYKVPIFLQISTDEVFGDIEEGFFQPDERMMPSNPYAATKAAAEMLVIAWARTYNIPFFISRTTNNYGPRQHTEKLIPNAITSLKSGRRIPIHGKGRQIRNWIHVSDNVAALMKIIDSGELNSVYHIASQDEVSVVEIVEKIAAVMGAEYPSCMEHTSDRTGQDVRYALATDEIEELGWRAEISLDDGLKDLVNQYSRDQSA